jgi:hypothetical protein
MIEAKPLCALLLPKSVAMYSRTLFLVALYTMNRAVNNNLDGFSIPDEIKQVALKLKAMLDKGSAPEDATSEGDLFDLPEPANQDLSDIEELASLHNALESGAIDQQGQEDELPETATGDANGGKNFICQ